MAGKGGAEPPKPQYYQVMCVEGHVIRGERTEGYQALRCPHCGDGVFVLPRSPLPSPPAPQTPRPKKRAAATVQEDIPIAYSDAPSSDDLEEIQWLEPERPARHSAPSLEKSRPAPRVTSPPLPSADPIMEAVEAEIAEDAEAPARPASKSKKPRSAVVKIEPDEDEDTEVEPSPGRIMLKAKPRPRAPIVWVTLGIFALVAGTISYRVWKQGLQELPHQAETNRSEGISALENGQFDDAKSKLGRAASAYKRLGARDELATSTRQLANEAAILADLAQDPLKDIVEEVAQLGDPDGVAKFASKYKGRSVLVDSYVLSTTGGVVDLDFRIFVGRGPVPAKTGRLDLSGLTLFDGGAMPKKGDRVFFGARLDAIRIEGGNWRIAFDPESGVLMTNDKALQAAGMGPSGSSEASQ